MQWGNLDLAGVTERIELISALGVRTDFTIKTIPPTTPGKRTTDKMFWTPLNDFWVLDDGNTAISGMSLVRGSRTFYENANISVEQIMINDGLFPFPFTPIDRMVRQVIGPLGSIDMRHLLYADSLFDLLMNATGVINEKLLANEAAQRAFLTIPNSPLYLVFPKAWRSELKTPPDNSMHLVWSFLGGNPLCSEGTATAFVHRLIDYNDGCTGSFPETIQPTRVMLVISLLALGNPEASLLDTYCSSGIYQEVSSCVNGSLATHQFINTYLDDQEGAHIQSLAGKEREELLRVNPSLIQFVVNNTNDSHHEVVYQSLMAAEVNDPWNLFGWWYALDWVTGKREVIRFEGDEGTLTVISAQASPSTLDLRGTEIPTNMSIYFLSIVQYTTMASILAEAMVVYCTMALFYTIANRGFIAGSNLLRSIVSREPFGSEDRWSWRVELSRSV